MRDEVIVAVIEVSRKDAQQYFQMVLPRDTRKVTGIECSALVKTALPANYESFLGNLQLQSEGQANLCYCTDIFLNRPEALIPTYGFSDNPAWMKRALEQGTASEPEPLEITDCHVIYGCYKDIIGKNLDTDIEYNVTCYIWIERPD